MKRLIALAAASVVAGGLTFIPANATATESQEPCVPKDAWTETIEHPEESHEVEHPAVTHEEKVVDSEAVPGQHYSLKGNSGLGKDETPVFPADYWQANTEQEPHDNGAGDPVTWVGEVGSGLHYASHGSEGLRDWFYYTAPQDEVSHIEVIIDKEAWTEKVIDKEAWTETIEHPAIICPPPPNEDKCPNLSRSQDELPDGWFYDEDGNCIPPGETRDTRVVDCDAAVVLIGAERREFFWVDDPESETPEKGHFDSTPWTPIGRPQVVPIEKDDCATPPGSGGQDEYCNNGNLVHNVSSTAPVWNAETHRWDMVAKSATSIKVGAKVCKDPVVVKKHNSPPPIENAAQVLPNTGGPNGWLAFFAAALISAGAALLYTVKRRA